MTLKILLMNSQTEGQPVNLDTKGPGKAQEWSDST